mgnify:CR=1 FL=1
MPTNSRTNIFLVSGDLPFWHVIFVKILMDDAFKKTKKKQEIGGN